MSREVGAALLAAAEGYTPRAQKLIEQAKEQLGTIHEVAAALAENLPAPKTQPNRARRRRRRKKKNGEQQPPAEGAAEVAEGAAPAADEAASPKPKRRRRRRKPQQAGVAEGGAPVALEPPAGVESVAAAEEPVETDATA
jgi:hypothetical protein